MDWIALWTAWLVSWEAKSWLQHLECVFGGILGAGMWLSFSSSQWLLPVLDRRTGTLRLNAAGAVVMSAVAALAVDVALPVGILVGAVAVPAFTMFNRAVLPAIGKVIVTMFDRRGGDGTNTQ